MAFAPAMAALRSRMETSVDDLPLAFDGEAFDRPSPARPWALVRFVGGAAGIRGVGVPSSRLVEQDGLMHVLVLVPMGAGAAAGAAIADAIGAHFYHVELAAPAAPDFVRTGSPRVDRDVAFDLVRDEADRGAYDVTLLSVPFTFYHFR